MTRGLVLFLFALTGCTTLRKTTAPDFPMNVEFRIGDTIIHAHVFQRGGSQPTMINVHDDENTSVIAGKTVVGQSGGRLIELSHGGHRNIRFATDGQQFDFDPNRIFSGIGIHDTLIRHGNYTGAAHRAVKGFAAQYLKRFALDRQPVIIALHNNTERALTIASYADGGEHAATAARIHIAPSRDPDDFFYVTDSRFFDYLRSRGFNVTLQDNANVPDDGSLSVYFGRKGIPYVNVEVEINHLQAQIEMVAVAHRMVEELILSKRP